jgi:predicted DCC family thiol-disulfide oxidoreductase YuxK
MERTLVFDGSCRFCTSAVQWAMRHAREPFAAVPHQAISAERYGLTIDQARESVWWIEGNLQLEGHRAVARVLRECRAPWPWIGLALDAPGLRLAASLGYDVIMRMRHRLPGSQPACRGPWDPFAGRADKPRPEARAHA